MYDIIPCHTTQQERRMTLWFTTCLSDQLMLLPPDVVPDAASLSVRCLREPKRMGYQQCEEEIKRFTTLAARLGGGAKGGQEDPFSPSLFTAEERQHPSPKQPLMASQSPSQLLPPQFQTGTTRAPHALTPGSRPQSL